MSVSRILETKSLPDIDYNTVDPQPFVESAKEILGEDNVYWMISYGTMQESEAFRHMCRALGMHDNNAEINEIGKNLDQYRNHQKWKDIIEDSKMFIDVINSVTPHPCANLLLSEPISEEVGLFRVGDESKGKKKIVYCALIDSDTSDSWKYLKNDFLTVTVWKIIADVFHSVNQPIPDIRTLSKLVENNQSVWDLYSNGITATLNQVGTDSGTPQVIQYKPQNLRELTGWVSAIRPSFASMKHYFLNREPFSYGITEFDEILKESDNFILYQENIMSALVYAGFSEDVTYGLLKAISKKKEGIIEPIHDTFIDGFVKKTGSEENALRVWKILEDSVGYGFNSSHSYAYALDSVYGAYLKAEYPLDYYKIVLNIYESNVKIQSKLMKELDYFKIKVKPIEFGKSKADYEADYETNTIYKGIASIKNLNAKIANSLYQLSKEKEYDTSDFVSLLIDIFNLTDKPDAGQMEILIQLDFFKTFGQKEVLLEIYQTFADRKKANEELYPEFAEQKYLEKVVKKRDGTLEEKWKTVKKLIVYKSDLTEKNFEERMQNIYEYQEAVKKNPPPKIELYEQIKFEKDVLGYAISVFENIDEDIVVVLDINTTYTPVVTVYRVYDGTEFKVKISKKNFFTGNDGQMLFEGDIICLLELVEKNGFKMVDGKWEENPNRKDLWCEKVQMIKRGKMNE
jgi:DNA polymerase III alpha subunit